jgi:histidinol-phosphate aminotransferase
MLAHAAVDGAQDEILFAWRAFEAYPIITAVAGASAVRVPLAAGHVHDVDAMAAAVTDATRLVFVCNPNNPTGTGIGVDALRRLVDTVDERALVVVDEAYHEYADAEAVPDAFALFADRPNVVVTRTFSKAYGLAGLRVGYCLAAPDVAAAVRKCQTPFSVTALAQHAAVAALGDEEEMRRRVKLTVAERERVQAALLGAGYQVPASQANFVWLALGEATTDVAERCLEAGVVIRPFTGEGARVTIGTSEENDAFLTAALGATAASLP